MLFPVISNRDTWPLKQKARSSICQFFVIPPISSPPKILLNLLPPCCRHTTISAIKSQKLMSRYSSSMASRTKSSLSPWARNSLTHQKTHQYFSPLKEAGLNDTYFVAGKGYFQKISCLVIVFPKLKRSNALNIASLNRCCPSP